MNIRWMRPSLCFLPAILAWTTVCYADSVNLNVGNYIYGEYPVYANQSLSETFTLNQATAVTSFNVEGFFPYSGYTDMAGKDSVKVTGPNGATPDGIWAPGTYTINYKAGSCEFCFNDVVGALNFYAVPQAFTQVGGSIDGNFGFSLIGKTVPDASLMAEVSARTEQISPGSEPSPVPEPATWALLGTGLIFVAGRSYKRQRS